MKQNGFIKHILHVPIFHLVTFVKAHTLEFSQRHLDLFWTCKGVTFLIQGAFLDEKQKLKKLERGKKKVFLALFEG